ncbi:MAG: hydroxymethylbilane synthase [Pseudomonadales bacterium]|nr:hydroxymethylbilane synthase [Pseudomonadales bacterium]
MKEITIATRESALALWQANFVRDKLIEAHPNLTVHLLGMTTQGDRWLNAPLKEIGGKGLFIKELEVAMLEGRADLAVHSVKDLPAHLPAGFSLPLIGYRDDVRDVLLGEPEGLAALPKNARVGSSSPRRQAQLLAMRPDLRVDSIRGNVQTRLSKLDSGEFDAIVLAQAGLSRLGLHRSDAYPFSVAQCLPAPGQGALGIETVADSPVQALLETLIDPDVARCVEAERGISLGLGADCALPVGAHAVLTANGDIHMHALVAQADGANILRAEGRGAEPGPLAQKLVEQLLSQGAERILSNARHR